MQFDCSSLNYSCSLKFDSSRLRFPQRSGAWAGQVP
jgi:hypothetical protein